MPKKSAGKEPIDASFPMSDQTWHSVAESLELSPQQVRVVELILCGKQDKQIATELGLSVPTIRTYLRRIFDRTQTSDRLSLVLCVFAIAQAEKPADS